MPVPKTDLLLLLSCEDLAKPPLQTTLSEGVQKRITEIGTGILYRKFAFCNFLLGQGSCVLIYQDPDSDFHLELVGWIGSISMRAYIPKSDCIHYLRLLGGDTSKFG